MKFNPQALNKKISKNNNQQAKNLWIQEQTLPTTDTSSIKWEIVDVYL